MKKILSELRFLMIILLLVFGPFWIISHIGVESNTPKAEKGVLDLSEWDFASNDTVPLNGEWEFYWDQLLTPADFTGGDGARRPELTGYIGVPGQWEGNINRTELRRHARATYRLVVKVPPARNMFGIKTEIIRVTNRLFVNGDMLGESGKPEDIDSVRGEILENTPYTAYFTSSGDRVEIILQVADYTYAAGGIIVPIRFGGQAAIQTLTRNSGNFELSVFAFLFCGALYHIGIYLFGRRDKSLLYFGLFCLLLSIFELTMGQKLLSQFIPNLSFDTMYDIRMVLIYPGAVMLTLFLQDITNGSLPVSYVKGVFALFGGYALAAFFVPNAFQVQAEKAFLPMVTGSYVLSILFLCRLLYRERYGNIGRMGLNLLILATWCIWINSVVIILQTHLLLINNRILGDISLIFFVMLMSYMLAIRFANAYTTIERMSEQLKEQDKLKDTFLSNTSHEFKTPLHGIINAVQTMLEDPAAQVTPQQEGNLMLIASVANRLSTLVNDILDFEKIKNNEIDLNIRAVDVYSTADAVIEVFRHVIKGREINLVNRIPEDLPLARADENRLRQVLYNLIGNAVKFTSQGEVAAKAMFKGDMLYISVIDTGIGIPQGKFEDIFLSYEQVSARRADEYGGAGLGLTITRQLVERMGGNIWVARSELDKGSEITFTLPVGVPDDAAQIQAPAVPSNIAAMDFPPEAELKNIKAGEFTVLAVDDEQTNLKVMLNVFARENYDVLTAANGAEALRMINESKKIDIVLLDVMMPGMTGYEVCRRLREEYSLLELPILLVTVRNMPEDVVAGFAAGANDFIIKPFQAKELRARVRTLLSLKKAVEDTARAEIAFLQSQIKPHFFYNALNTIMSFCYTDGVKAGKLLAEFSNYLRQSFDIQDISIHTSLEKELSLVKSYVAIEQARFGDRLVVTYDIDPCLLNWQLPPLLIQPLVENAVRHGLMSREEGGHIKITVWREADDMVVEVADDGSGMSADMLAGLLQGGKKSRGVGLHNINRRLLKFYGRTLSIESQEGHGTKVVSMIPRRGFDAEGGHYR